MNTMIFRATREQAALMAEACGLRHEITSVRPDDEFKMFPNYQGGRDPFDMWQDSQTGGGGCRLVWRHGIVWVSRHSGYAYADITQEVCDLFHDMGCKPYNGEERNPHTYGR
jgi:hypothetical protein